MWGNRLGWMISAGIVVVTVGLYAMLLMGPSPTPPTSLTMHAGAMDALELPGNPKSLITAGGSADAAELYKQAIANFRSNPNSFDQYYKGGKLNSAEYQKVIPTIDLIVEASRSAGATVFAKRPEAAVKYHPDQSAALSPLDQIGHVALRIGLQYNAGKKPDPETAKKYWKAVYALGVAMASERLTFRELQIGIDLLQTAAINLGTSNDPHAADFAAIGAKSTDFMTAQTKFMGIMNPSYETVIKVNAGDVFKLAQDSQERMWRVEAIMMIGHYRYMAVNPGDQVASNKVLAKLAMDQSLDPAVAMAVKVAQNLTIEQHRTSQQMP